MNNNEMLPFKFRLCNFFKILFFVLFSLTIEDKNEYEIALNLHSFSVRGFLGGWTGSFLEIFCPYLGLVHGSHLTYSIQLGVSVYWGFWKSVFLWN